MVCSQSGFFSETCVCASRFVSRPLADAWVVLARPIQSRQRDQVIVDPEDHATELQLLRRLFAKRQGTRIELEQLDGVIGATMDMLALRGVPRVELADAEREAIDAEPTEVEMSRIEGRQRTFLCRYRKLVTARNKEDQIDAGTGDDAEADSGLEVDMPRHLIRKTTTTTTEEFVASDSLGALDEALEEVDAERHYDNDNDDDDNNPDEAEPRRPSDRGRPRR